MNKYWITTCLVIFVAWSGFMYYEGYSKSQAVCKASDEKHDLAQAAITVAAQQHVIATVSQQQTITQEVDHAYEAKESYIDNLYGSGISGMQPAPASTSNSLPAPASTPQRTDVTPSQSRATAVFKLNAKECDENTEQLYSLQDWIRQQQAAGRKSAPAQ